MRHKPRQNEFKKAPAQADRYITEWEEVQHKQNQATKNAEWWAGIERKLNGRNSGASTAISNAGTMKGYYQSVASALDGVLDSIESDLSGC